MKLVQIQKSQSYETPVQMERIKSILELDEEKISLQIFKEHNQFLQKSNEYLMIANKRL